MVKEAVLRILNTRLHLCAEVRTLPLRMDFFAQQGNGHHQTVTSIHSRPPCAAQASRHFVDIAGHWVKVTIASTGSRAVFKIVCCVKQSHRCLPPPLQLQVGRIPADLLPAPWAGSPYAAEVLSRRSTKSGKSRSTEYQQATRVRSSRANRQMDSMPSTDRCSYSSQTVGPLYIAARPCLPSSPSSSSSSSSCHMPDRPRRY